MSNLDIREEIKTAGLKLWQVAQEYGINDGNFSRKLRRELSDTEKQKISAIIAKLTQRGGEANERAAENANTPRSAQRA